MPTDCQPKPETQKKKIKICPKCKAEFDYSRKYCPQCDQKLKRVGADRSAIYRRIKIAAILVLIAGSLFICIYLIVNKDHEEAARSTSTYVVITKTGDKFHTYDCYYVTNRTNTQTVSRREAIEMGKTPCSVCGP